MFSVCSCVCACVRVIACNDGVSFIVKSAGEDFISVSLQHLHTLLLLLLHRIICAHAMSSKKENVKGVKCVVNK